MNSKKALLCIIGGGEKLEYIGTVNITVGEDTSNGYIGFMGLSGTTASRFGELTTVDGDLVIYALYHWFGNEGNSPVTTLLSGIGKSKVKLENKTTGRTMKSFYGSDDGIQVIFLNNPFEGIEVGQTCSMAFYA